MMAEALRWVRRPGSATEAKMPKMVELGLRMVAEDGLSSGADDDGFLSLAETMRGEMDKLAQIEIDKANRAAGFCFAKV